MVHHISGFTYMYIHICTVCTYLQSCMYCVCIIYTYACIHLHTCTYIYVLYVHTYSLACTVYVLYTRMHAYIYIHVYTFISHNILSISIYHHSPYLPLPDKPSMEFSIIPEFFIEDMIEFLLFCAQ